LIEYMVYIVWGYLSGCILFGAWIPRLLKGVDVREEARDNNPGTANAFLYGGTLCGILVLLGDILKGVLPVHYALERFGTFHPALALIMAAPVLGHTFPIQSLFGRKTGKGGKGIAVSFGVLLGLYPFLESFWLLVFWYLLFSAVVILNPHSLRTVVSFLFLLVSSILFRVKPVITVGTALISLAVTDKHRKELKREKEKEIRFVFRRN
jgi:glycerol-3-phosphate acyltransferase PlsY